MRRTYRFLGGEVFGFLQLFYAVISVGMKRIKRFSEVRTDNFLITVKRVFRTSFSINHPGFQVRKKGMNFEKGPFKVFSLLGFMMYIFLYLTGYTFSGSWNILEFINILHS